MVKNYKPLRDNLIYKCENCNQLNLVLIEELYLEFDCVDSSAGSMGEKNLYQTTCSINCITCINKISIIFSIWEYPDGKHDNDKINIENGQIIQSPDFVRFFWENY
jgi:hypothetical protein